MGERAKVILNEYYAKDLLMKDTLDLDKFYTADLKLFVEVARKEIERLNNIIKDIEEYINFLVIFNQTINGRFSETIWGQEILSFIKDSDK